MATEELALADSLSGVFSEIPFARFGVHRHSLQLTRFNPISAVINTCVGDTYGYAFHCHAELTQGRRIKLQLRRLPRKVLIDEVISWVAWDSNDHQREKITTAICLELAQGQILSKHANALERLLQKSHLIPSSWNATAITKTLHNDTALIRWTFQPLLFSSTDPDAFCEADFYVGHDGELRLFIDCKRRRDAYFSETAIPDSAATANRMCDPHDLSALLCRRRNLEHLISSSSRQHQVPLPGNHRNSQVADAALILAAEYLDELLTCGTSAAV